ncbi:MAG TPA: Glu-tRNA(Gln) amidotransferase subunit GatE [Myxococcota bacterium]|nr:Glu-tRNA(Gln) amidotransferase subunit GatE [Myxococcota bacterium]
MENSIDYDEVGLIVGLEVHQQLLTAKKMFCHCPAGLYTKTHDGVMLRHMRPTLSELGEYDGTALMEFKTKKNIIYLLHKNNVCTYEMDDTPPFLVNQQALDVTIEQCLMLGCDIVDEVHIARKQYLDGSIPTGFQRTAIVGVNGKLPFRGRELSITQVSVEEDSCREVSDRGHLVVWRTDRLGIPLIETVTGADLRTPDEVEEAILLIGMVCRSTGHVRTGIGASRQDVNVSVRGGRRVEIKGVPQAWWAPGLVHGEAVRQINLLRLRDELGRRGLKQPEDVHTEHQDVTSLFETSKLSFLRRSGWDRFVNEEQKRPGFELGEGSFCVRAVKLCGLAGTLGWPTQREHIFAHELAGRVRVIAGLDQQPILLHSEKWPDYIESPRELRRLKKATGCEQQDAVVVVWGPLEDTLTAAEEIRLRYVDALDGVPNETRQPFLDGSTDFERILPGPDRMYPDTDSPPNRMMPERVERLRKTLPDLPWEREKRYAQAGVPRATIHYLIRRNGAALVDRLSADGADLRRACFFFGERLKALKRKGVAVESISPEDWSRFFRLAAARPALWDIWPRLVERLAAAPDKDIDRIIAEEGLDRSAGQWQSRLVEEMAHRAPDHTTTGPGRFRYQMGQIMPGLRGRVPAADVAAAVRDALAG